MLRFHFRPGKSAFMALMMALVSLFCAWFWLKDGGTLPLIVGLLCLAGAGKVAADALSGTPALVVDEAGLQVRKTWGAIERVAWPQVQQLSMEVMTLRYFGIIPVARHETLVIKCDGGLFGSRRLRLALKMMQLPPGGSAQLMQLLHEAHVGAVGQARIAMAGAGAKGWGADSLAAANASEGQAFDADAALQRYLARRDAQSAAGTVAHPETVRPAQPQRPSFGRKAQTAP